MNDDGLRAKNIRGIEEVEVRCQIRRKIQRDNRENAFLDADSPKLRQQLTVAQRKRMLHRKLGEKYVQQ